MIKYLSLFIIIVVVIIVKARIQTQNVKGLCWIHDLLFNFLWFIVHIYGQTLNNRISSVNNVPYYSILLWLLLFY